MGVVPMYPGPADAPAALAERSLTVECLCWMQPSCLAALCCFVGVGRWSCLWIPRGVLSAWPRASRSGLCLRVPTSVRL